MNLQEFSKISINRFKGLYARGSTDLTPPDHAIDVKNIRFDRSGEAYTREGLGISLNLSHPVQRTFLSTTKNGYNVITQDGTTLYAYNPSTGHDSIIYQDVGLKEFAAVNAFGRTYIYPMGDVDNNLVLLVWDGISKVRPACGFPPPGSFQVVTAGGVGSCDVGHHRFAFSYITDTGFMTRPGPVPYGAGFAPVSWIAPGGTPCQVVGLPLGPSTVIARQIFATKAEEEEFFYVPSGYIDDNTTTTVTLDFYDTDLVESANDLFNLRDEVEGAFGDIGGIFKYHGRLFIWGRTLPKATGRNDDWGPDKIFVSEAGDPESFDMVHGWMQLPTEYDGNTVRAAVEIRDSLYFIKSVGIISTADNLDHPFTWKPVRVDGGCGCGFWGISSIVGSQTALSTGEQVIFVDFGGIYLFNGVVQQPQLTWKIKNFWDRIDASQVLKSHLCHDPFNQTFYALVPVFNDSKVAIWTLLVADYSEGLSADGIKWSIWDSPVPISTISLMSFQDSTNFLYRLRFGSSSPGLFKYDDDFVVDLDTNKIVSSYETFLAGFGNISIFRALNLRVEGTPNLVVGLKGLDNLSSNGNKLSYQSASPVPLISGIEQTRQINYTAEKMLVRIEGTTPWRVQKIEIYGKTQYMSRPLAR